MSDYIKRSEAMELIVNYFADNIHRFAASLADELRTRLSHAANINDRLAKVPAADVVEVVRCRDCKYYGVYADGLCEAWEEITKPNGYCYVGERVSEDD